jgi:phenylacetate-CoA ligase
MESAAPAVPASERLGRESLAQVQGRRLEALVKTIYGRNLFYTRKFDAAGIDIRQLRFPADLTKLPFTTKSEFVADQVANPPWGTALTEPLERYTRYCQTSSTTGAPLRWLDTNESWQWVMECWKAVFRAARVGPGDRIFFPFSFGPFLGFWSAFDAGSQIGAQCVPGGGMSSSLRLKIMETISPTVVCATPTYALRLAEVSAAECAENGARPLAEFGVRAVIVAGEPGGSIPATRERIEQTWGARVIDHHGLTETGPVSFECWESPGALHVNEAEYIGEVVNPATGAAVPDGEQGELVITNLGRTASPAIRYRTGDVVRRRSDSCACGRTWARLEGGVLSRADDMVNIRGVNVYPGAIESIIRRFPEIAEFRSTASRAGAMWTLAVEIEPFPAVGRPAQLPAKVAARLLEALGLHVQVRLADLNSLPRFEMKARRFVVQR